MNKRRNCSVFKQSLEKILPTQDMLGWKKKKSVSLSLFAHQTYSQSKKCLQSKNKSRVILIKHGLKIKVGAKS